LNSIIRAKIKKLICVDQTFYFSHHILSRIQDKTSIVNCAAASENYQSKKSDLDFKGITPVSDDLLIRMRPYSILDTFGETESGTAGTQPDEG